MKVVLASLNKGKIKELQAVLNKINLDVISQAELNVPEVAEDGLTFIENALIKARHVCRFTNMPAIADDSGLVVPVLNGEPGIYSSRYAGPHSDSQQNIQKLLAELATVQEKDRHAYFFCTLVYMIHAEDPAPIICQGTWHGSILTKPTGTQGFGYDPVFYLSELNKSAAQLTLEEKNQYSHRGQALRSLLNTLIYKN